MRRGTPAAYEFGKWLEARRINLGLSMRAVGDKIGVVPATVSQVERGERALKEPRLSAWAKALEISESRFRSEWNKVQRENPDPPIVRARRRTVKVKTIQDRFKELTGAERQQVLGYMDAIIEMREQ